MFLIQVNHYWSNFCIQIIKLKVIQLVFYSILSLCSDSISHSPKHRKNVNAVIVVFVFSHMVKLLLILTHSYLPPLKEETISSQVTSFLPNETRKTLFSGKTFIFISKKQVRKITTMWGWRPEAERARFIILSAIELQAPWNLVDSVGLLFKMSGGNDVSQRACSLMV